MTYYYTKHKCKQFRIHVSIYKTQTSIFCHNVSIFQMADYLLSLRRLNVMTYVDRNDVMLIDSIFIRKDNL